MAVFRTLLKEVCNVYACRCCACGKKLTDSVSIEKGIGPVCRKKYGYEDAPIIPLEKHEAVVALIGQVFPPEFAAHVEVPSSGKSRELANCTSYYLASLVKWRKEIRKCAVETTQSNSSSTNDDEVLIASDDCVEAPVIIRGRVISGIKLLDLMGYTLLALRIAKYHFRHKIVASEDNLLYSGPYNLIINSHFKAQFGGRWIEKRWHLNGTASEVITLLMQYEAGSLQMYKPQIVLRVQAEQIGRAKRGVQAERGKQTGQDNRGAQIGQTRQAKQVGQARQVRRVRYIAVTSPYSKDFIAAIKGNREFRGWWNPREKAWMVLASMLDALKEVIKFVYPEVGVVVVYM